MILVMSKTQKQGTTMAEKTTTGPSIAAHEKGNSNHDFSLVAGGWWGYIYRYMSAIGYVYWFRA